MAYQILFNMYVGEAFSLKTQGDVGGFPDKTAIFFQALDVVKPCFCTFSSTTAVVKELQNHISC